MLGAMRIELNGEIRELEPGMTVLQLLRGLGIVEAQPVAVERNREIVPRAAHASTVIADGDSLEVVQFVGGG